MFKEPVPVVKSRRASLQQQQLSGSLVSAVLDSASSVSPRIYPLDHQCSIELVDTNNSLQHNDLHPSYQKNNTNGYPSNISTSSSPSNNHNLSHSTSKPQQNTHSHSNRINHPSTDKRIELCLDPATAPPYPHVHRAPASLALGIRDSDTTSTTTNSPSPPASGGCGGGVGGSATEKAKEAQIVPESNGIGRRLLNGFYDDFLDGLPFRRQPANTYCDPPARRYSLMGRAGTARNSEFKRNPIAQHRQR